MQHLHIQLGLPRDMWHNYSESKGFVHGPGKRAQSVFNTELTAGLSNLMHKGFHFNKAGDHLISILKTETSRLNKWIQV